MQRYILRRFVQSVALLFVLALIIFALARVSGNPADLLLREDARSATLWTTRRRMYRCTGQSPSSQGQGRCSGRGIRSVTSPNSWRPGIGLK